MSFARREPGARRLAARGPGAGSRVLSWLGRVAARDLDDQRHGEDPPGDQRGANAMRVVLAGGRSAGNIEPDLALAGALRQADGSIQVTCLRPRPHMETRLVRSTQLELIPAVPLPRYGDAPAARPCRVGWPARSAPLAPHPGPGRGGRPRRLRRVRGNARVPGRQAAQGDDRGARGQIRCRASPTR